jgi:catechol 2,3-dioxygenase-like lactoylglutathione lyase family enzyme
VTAPAIAAFHTCVVVRDLDDAINRFTKSLGIGHWHHWDRFPPGATARMAYGHGNGMTFEVFAVDGNGETQFDRFLREKGEGVQHIGFWTPDVRGSVAAALDAGGKVVSGARDAAGNTTVQVTPGNLDAITFGAPTFVDAGTGFLIEYFGPGGDTTLRDWLKDDFGVIVEAPSWA